MLKLIPGLSLAFILVACSQPGPLTQEENLAVQKEVRQTLTHYYEDIRREGLTAEFNYLDSSADFFWVPPGYSQAINYDSVAAVLKKNAPQFALVENHLISLRMTPLSRELAAYNARLSSRMVDTAGKETSLILVETGLMIRRSGGWKLLNGQTAVVNP